MRVIYDAKIKDANSKIYTFEEMLKEEGIYHLSTTTYFTRIDRFITVEYHNIFVTLYFSCDMLQPIDNSSWSGSTFLKCNETLELIFRNK